MKSPVGQKRGDRQSLVVDEPGSLGRRTVGRAAGGRGHLEADLRRTPAIECYALALRLFRLLND